ncbi:hypothetical protein V5F38_05320 [Xanthobacter sp. V0B-10]|uniref:hypothetical protein n=1 Tax=Xanthobacter albus TaxID=3119929 RepID=UPI003726B1A4
MSAHSPGPWSSFNAFENRGGCFAADGKTLVAHLPNPLPVDTHRRPLPEEADANFRLIDAAPDLLSIAKRWAALDGGAWNVERHAAEKAELLADTKATIAKAEGRNDD